jgi:hypothetical protein
MTPCRKHSNEIWGNEYSRKSKWPDFNPGYNILKREAANTAGLFTIARKKE